MEPVLIIPSMQFNQPLLSIIIPDRSRPKFVLEAIRSIYSQSGIPKGKTEIILVIDHNNRYPKSKIRNEFPLVKIITNAKEEGPGGSRNVGLKQAGGKFVSFLDSDDSWHPNFLKESISYLDQSNAGASMCFVNPYFSGYYPFREKLKVILINKFRQAALTYSFFFNNRFLTPNLFWTCQLSHSIFRRSSIGNYVFEYKYRRGGEDWAIFIYILKRGQIVVVPEKLVKFRYEINSSTNQKINQLNKWQSYTILKNNLPVDFKKGMGFKLFGLYLYAIKPRK